MCYFRKESFVPAECQLVMLKGAWFPRPRSRYVYILRWGRWHWDLSTISVLKRSVVDSASHPHAGSRWGGSSRTVFILHWVAIPVPGIKQGKMTFGHNDLFWPLLASFSDLQPINILTAPWILSQRVSTFGQAFQKSCGGFIQVQGIRHIHSRARTWNQS